MLQQQQETQWTIDSSSLHERNEMDVRRNEKYERRIEITDHIEILNRVKTSEKFSSGSFYEIYFSLIILISI